MTLFPNKVSQTIAWTQTIISLGCMIGEYWYDIHYKDEKNDGGEAVKEME